MSLAGAFALLSPISIVFTRKMHWMSVCVWLCAFFIRVAACKNITAFNWNDLEQNSLSPIVARTQMERDIIEAQQEEWALLAKENLLGMHSDSIRCATPRPRVIKVQNVHPHASKRYVPSCVALHRCNKEAGCCDNEDAVCSPTTKKKIYMYFYVVTLGELNQNGVTSIGVYGQVERLRFTNHTQCGCRKRKVIHFTPNLQQSVNSATTGQFLKASCICLAFIVALNMQLQVTF